MKAALKIIICIVAILLLRLGPIFSMSLLNNKTLIYSLSIKDGLIDNKVNCLLQDEKGFLWIGTRRGLCKYDGYEFTHIKLDSNKKIININDLYEDDNGKIWVGAQLGLYVYDNVHANSSKVEVIDYPVRKIRCISDDGLIIVGKTSVASYLPEKNELKTLYCDSLKLINDVYMDGDKFWIGTNKGLFRKLPTAIVKDSVLTGNIVEMFSDSQGNVWVASYRDGITRINLHNNKYYHYLNKSSKHYALHVNAIMEYASGKILVGCDNGLIGLDYANNKSEIVADNKLDDRFIYSFLKDDNNGLWIGTYNNGLNYLSSNKSLFSTLENYEGGNTISQFVEDNSGNLWIASDDAGVYKYNSLGNTQEAVCEKIGLSFYNSHAMMIQGDKLWVGLYMRGIDIIDINLGKRIGHIDLSTNIYQNSVYSLYTDLNGNVWAGTLSGLFLMENGEQKFMPVINNILSDKCMVRSIQQDSDGTLWFGSLDYGLYSYNLNTGKWKEYELLRGKAVNTLCYHKGLLFIGTNNGIVVYDKVKNIFFNLIETDAMSICSLIGYKEKIWFSAFNSIGEYDMSSRVIKQYGINDGVNAVPFSVGSGTLTSDGRILFGGTKGIEAFYPDKFSEKKEIKDIRLTQFKIFYNVVDVGQGTPLTRSIVYADKINLNHNQRTFSISFSSMDFFNERRVRYEYMLKGFDKKWISADGINEAKYTNIPAGSYEFVVRNKLANTGNWGNNGTFIRINVGCHPLLSRVALCIYLVFLLCLVYFIFRYYKYRIRSLHEREAFDAKMDFFTNITHEIKTPLSLISGPVESLLRNEGLSEDVKEDLQIIERNSEILEDLVSELLDFKKIESNLYTIRKEACNLYTIVDDVVYRYKSLCKLKNINLSVNYNQENRNLQNCETDIDSAGKIINNIVSNAVKYTNNKVDVTCVEDGSFMRISVTDNGGGINETDYEKIFKPLVRLNSVPKFSTGTGLGLSLVRSLCLLLDWKIEIDSEINIGTKVTLCIPLAHTNQILLDSCENEMTVINNDLYTILLIDDNIDILRLMSKQLKNHFNTMICMDSSLALDMVKNTRVDVIVSDLMMPKMNGIELCEMIKNNIATSHIPVFMLLL